MSELCCDKYLQKIVGTKVCPIWKDACLERPAGVCHFFIAKLKEAREGKALLLEDPVAEGPTRKSQQLSLARL